MSKRKLLLADDSVTVQKVVNLAFESEDIEVITADNGISALEKFSEFSPDLVMADINIPGADGYEICERIKQNEKTRHIPVILLVGSFEPFSEEKAQRVGASGFLKKPFQSIGMLINKVTELIVANDAHEQSSETEFGEANTQQIPVYESPEPENAGFADTLEFEQNQSSGGELGEDGIDDEMIEAHRIADYALMDETSKYETSLGFEVTSGNQTEDANEDRAMNYGEAEDLDLSEQDDQTSEETVYELADEPGDAPSAEAYSYGEEADSYEDYSAYQPADEPRDLPPARETSALSLDDIELLELPPLNKIEDTAPENADSADEISEDYSIRDNQPEDDDVQTEPTEADTLDQEDGAPETVYSDSGLAPAEDFYSNSPAQRADETEESYFAPAEESAADFENSDAQNKTAEDTSETTEPESTEFAEESYSSETLTAENEVSVDEEESSAADFEEPTAQSFASQENQQQSQEEDQPQTEVFSQNQSMIAQETQQVISQASDSKVVVHYLPPEVIDEIAERVVEKLAEKLRR